MYDFKQRKDACEAVYDNIFSYNYKDNTIKNIDAIKDKLTELVDKIDKGEALSNQEFAFMRNSSRNIKDSAA